MGMGTTATCRREGKFTKGRGRMGDTARGVNTAPNTTANNTLVVRGRGPHQGIVIGRPIVVNTKIGKGKQLAITPRNGPPTRFGGTSGLGPNIRFGGATELGPNTRLGGKGSLAPRGSMRSTRIGNAIFWPQSTRSSTASCGSSSSSGSGSDSATMPTAPKQYSQGASSTPSTQKSTT